MKHLFIFFMLAGLSLAETEDSKGKKPIIRAFDEKESTISANNFHQPEPTYQKPTQHTGGTYAQHQPDSSGYYYYYYPVAENNGKYPSQQQEETGLGTFDVFTPFVVILVVAILISFFFPSTFAVHNSRSYSSSPYMMLEDLNALSNTVLGALESEQCFNKLVCETGSIVKKVKYTDMFINMLKNYIPERYTFTMQMLKASMSDKETCKRFNCGPNPYRK